MTRLVPLVLAALALVVPASASARPTVLLIHGGAWYYTGPAITATMAPTAKRFAKLGWNPVSVDYRAGAAGLQDVLAAYDTAAAGGDRVCAYGESAGAQWALLLAARRPALDCVIGVATPADLLDPESPTLTEIAQRALAGPTWVWNPMSYTRRISARVLLAAGDDDTLTPVEQSDRFAAAVPGTQVVTMPAGKEKWMHGTSTKAARRSLRATEASFLAG